MAKRGGASIGQPMSFFKGAGRTRKRAARTRLGRRVSGGFKSSERTRLGRRVSGGFYPSLMGGVLQNGPYLVTAAFAQGSRLVSGNKERMASRGMRETKRRSRTRRTAKA